ncbi:MAG: aldehyde dehydrogenase family protein [Deltaproteobacteria bacterium]|nr:aldehyde dehydrogenase family protein [Deltaproteobacteria bacterium]
MGLLAGNAVILKTATETQLAGRTIEGLILDAGLPKDVFTFINLPGRIAGDLFLESGIDKLFFTGSVPIGKKLMAKAAETLTPVSLELGGNDAMLVCPDADLDRAATGAVWAGMQNAGQSCGGAERVYVHKDAYNDFMELLGNKVHALRVGVETEHEVDMGAITTKRQLETVKRHVEEALSKGAVIHAESNCPTDTAGLFHPAVVLANCDHTMTVMREETFGPVLGVMKVESMDEAVELANDSNLGLTGSVWSRDSRRAEAIARRIHAGAITINDHLMSHGAAETPWGGFKESGIGRTHGDIGFAEMTEPQVIVHDWLPGVKKNFWWHPHGPEIYGGLLGALDLLYGKGVGRRLSGMTKLLKVFPRTFQR